MKRVFACALLLVGVAIGSAADQPKLDLREQYKRDALAILLRDADRTSPPPNVDVSKVLEDAAADAERQIPGIFDESSGMEIPSDKSLTAARAVAERAYGEIPRSPFWLHYFERWKDGSLSDAQRVLLRRFLLAFADYKEKEKLEYARKRKKG